MSTVLFITTNKPITENYLQLRKDFQLCGVRHALQLSKYDYSDYLDGNNYYFDCMFTLFSDSLEKFQDNKKTYLTLQRCYKWFNELVGSLLKDGYEITLCVYSFAESKAKLKEKSKICLKLLDGNIALNYATPYLITE